jgi:hypothetical protein
MKNEDMARAYVRALEERDQRWHELQKAERLYQEAFSRACELELVCFEPLALLPPATPHGSITAQVMALFESRPRCARRMKHTDLTRQQVQTVISRMLRKKRLHKQARGVYVTVKKETK